MTEQNKPPEGFNKWLETKPLLSRHQWNPTQTRALQQMYMTETYKGAVQEARQVMRDAERTTNPVEHERYYNNLQPWEQKLFSLLPSAAGSFGAWWNDQPDSIKKAASAAGGFLAPFVAPAAKVLQGVGTVLDVGAEGIERIGGMADQWQHAKATGTEDEFFKNLDDAWKASSFYYDVTAARRPFVQAIRNPDGSLKSIQFPALFGGTPSSADVPGLSGVESLAYARRRYSEGADWATVQGELQEKYGSLWMRGQMWDMIGHIFIDPLNIVMPYLKPIERLKLGIEGLELMKPASEVRYLDDALRVTERAMEVVQSGEKVLPDELVTVFQKAEEQGLGFGDTAVQLAKKAVEEGPGSQAAKDLRTLWEKGIEQIRQAAPHIMYENSWQEKARRILQMADIGPTRLTAEGKLAMEGRKASIIKPWTWFQLTPQSRAMELMERVSTYVQSILGDAKDIKTIEGRMAAVIRSVSSSPLEPKLVSHEVRTLRAALGQSGVAWDDIFKAWADTADKRGLLNQIASMLGKDAKRGGLDEVLRMIQKDSDNVVNRVLEVVKNGKIPQTDDAMALAKVIGDGLFTKEEVKSLATMFFDRKVPFDIGSLKLHLQGATYDAIARQMVFQLGEQSRGIWLKAADVLKASETLAYLKLNPGYPIRNFLNNELTMAFRGVWGRWGDAKNIEKFWARVGFVPERLKEGLGPAAYEITAKRAESIAAQSLEEAEKAAKRMIVGETAGSQGFLGNLSRRIGDINLGKLDMARLGSEAEQAASQRALTSGYQKYMRSLWRGGAGYEPVGKFISQRYPGLDLGVLGPDFERNIERSIRGAVGGGDLDDIFTKDLATSFDNILEKSAERMGLRVDDLKQVLPDEYLEVLRKDLGDALQTRNIDEVNRVLDSAQTVVNQHLDEIMKVAIKLRAQKVVEVLETEGPGSFMTFWRNATDQFQGGMEAHLQTLHDQWPMIRALPAKEQGPAVARLLHQERAGFKRLMESQREFVLQIRQAAQKANIRLPGDPLREFDAMATDMEKFFADRGAALNRFHGSKAFSTEGLEGAELMAVEAKRENAWLALNKKLDTQYKALIESMYQHGMSVDDAISVAAARSPEQLRSIRAGRYVSHELRKQYMEAERKFRQEMAVLPRHTKLADRTALQMEWAAEREHWQGLIHIAEREAQDSMQAGADFGAVHILNGDIKDPRDIRKLMEAYDLGVKNVAPRMAAEQAAKKAAKEVAQEAGEAGAAKVAPRGVGNMAAMNTSMRLNMIPEEVTMDPLNEVWMKGGPTIFESLRQSSREAIENPAMRIDDLLKNLPEAEAAKYRSAITAYVEHLHTKMPEVQRISLRMGEALRDSALLNYKRRTYFDNGMALFMPFGFWTTHSVWNWALWTLNRPAGMHTWFQIREYLDSAGRKEVPTRLRGMLPVPFLNIPGVPDWMGTIYASPSRIGWPMDGWVDPLSQTYNAGVSNISRAGRLIEKWKSEGKITQAEYSSALRQNGPVWEQAMGQSVEQDGYDGMDTLSMLLAPHAPLQWAYKIARGQADDIGPFLPLTRTVKGITALLGVPGGVNIEGWMRERLGLPRFDKWEDYRIDRMISDLVSSGQITADEGQRAMIDRKGSAYDLAVEGAGKEFGISALGSMLGVPLKAYPTGEENARVNTQMLYDAYAKEEETGMTGIVNKVMDDHPDIQVRLALFDTPEDRMKSFLIDHLWDQYNSLPTLSRNAVKDTLGQDFIDNFLVADDSGRRSYAVDNRTLGLWLRLMGGDPPGTLDLSGEKAQAIPFPPEQIAQKAELYYEQRNQQFGDEIWAVQEEYFKYAEGSAARAQFRAMHPELARYWNWRQDWLMRNPDVLPYLVENPDDPRYKYTSIKQLQYVTQNTPNMPWSSWVTHFGEPSSRLMVDYFTDEGPMPATTKRTLEREADLYGITYDEFVATLEASYQEGK